MPTALAVRKHLRQRPAISSGRRRSISTATSEYVVAAVSLLQTVEAAGGHGRDQGAVEARRLREELVGPALDRGARRLSSRRATHARAIVCAARTGAGHPGRTWRHHSPR